MSNKEFKVKIIKDASLKNFCTFKIGGTANFVFIVENTHTLIQVCKFCTENNIKFKVIGFGANLLFDDEGFDGAIIVNKSKKVKFGFLSVKSDSGVSVGSLINKCIKRNCSGLENFAGIPSTVGGAVVNSLGAFNSNFSDLVDYVVCFNPDTNKIVKIKANDCKFGYRTSIFKTCNLVILWVKLRFKFKRNKDIKNTMNSCLKTKQQTQPTNQLSAGSVFKRGTIVPALEIDKLGLKGTRIGDAQISTKHAGFIINLGSATSQDVKNLINLINIKILENYGCTLETEIEFVNK